MRDSYPASGGSPVADAHRAGEAVWIGPEEFAGSAESRHVPSSGFSLAVLPVRGDGGGCLLALTEHPDGFDADGRACLELIAEAITCPVPAATTESAEAGDLQPDAFTLAMDTGRAEVGDEILRLFGLAPEEFDGKVETLLGLTVPEDLPSLMSVTESDHMTIGERELEFPGAPAHRPAEVAAAQRAPAALAATAGRPSWSAPSPTLPRCART
ncbi:SpoIIE family protein phosphatase OS=Streptomyces tendae OX=1932 GN=GUR47_04685 PE=4 SV=1 [Streptomyces tendae]